MSGRGGEIRMLPVGNGWICGVASGVPQARAAVLLLPAFFHEAQRAHRLFAVLADALAKRHVACLRIDYRGTGDASSEDSEFLPSRAIEDALAAWSALRTETAGPAVLLGVRAGALVAEAAARRLGAPWWAWQPVEDGRAHLDTLRDRDRFERNNRLRFPFRGRPQALRDDQLMGHRIHPEFALELGILRQGSAPALRIDVGLDDSANTLALPEELGSWVDQVDLQGRTPVATLDALAERLSGRLALMPGATP